MARTPSKEAHEKVLQAVRTLIGERGIEATSMDLIAATAGVSKATVYKHWENKDALLIDCIRIQSLQAPAFDSGNPRQDFVDLLTHLGHANKREELARIWPRIISYATANPGFGKVLQERLFEPRRAGIAILLKRAAEAGQIQPDLNPDLAADLLIGPIMHRRFVNDNQIPADLPEQVVAAFFRAFAPR